MEIQGFSGHALPQTLPNHDNISDETDLTGVAVNDPAVVRSTEEWEAEIGRQVRELRIGSDRTQEELARDANVAVSTLRSLEQGEGSSLRTLVQVVRALGREDWLGRLAPSVGVRPMDLLRGGRSATPRRRARGSR